jgi:hypothetical protein
MDDQKATELTEVTERRANCLASRLVCDEYIADLKQQNRSGKFYERLCYYLAGLITASLCFWASIIPKVPTRDEVSRMIAEHPSVVNMSSDISYMKTQQQEISSSINIIRDKLTSGEISVVKQR